MSKDLNDLRELILNEFRENNCQAGHCIMARSFQLNLYNSLNPQEQELFNPAMDSLLRDGLVEYKDGNTNCLFLTAKGFTGLYPCKSDKELEQLILDLFAKQNCRVGEGFMTRIYELQVLDKLNPVEKMRIQIVLANLLNNNVITMSEDRNFMKLGQKGYDLIY